MGLDEIVSWLSENPTGSAALLSTVAGLAAFTRPIARAARAALIRRIDQAWEDDECDDHESRIRRTVDIVNGQTIMPRRVIESEARTQYQHKR